MNDAVRRFVDDLLEAGVSTRRRAVLALLYHRALMVRSVASWTRLYRAIFSALHLLSHETSATTPRSSAARRSLLRIAKDDLGSELFGDAAVNRLAASLGVRARVTGGGGRFPRFGQA